MQTSESHPVDKQPLLPVTEARPAYYPFGAWGAGYLIDDRTEASLEAYSAWSGWISLTIYMLAINARYVFSLTTMEATAMGWLAVVAVGYVARRYILRNSPRVRPASAEDLLRLEVMQYGRTYLLRLNAGFLIFFSVAALGFAPGVEGADRWLLPLAATGLIVPCIVKIVRIRHLQELPAAEGG